LVSPGDLGELIKPFVFLDYIEAPAGSGPNFGFHPHSGIATLTFPITFEIQHETSTGQIDTVKAGGLEWMMAGSGIWHRGKAGGESPLRGFQTWFSMPPSHENSEPCAQFLQAAELPEAGPVKLLLGTYGNLRSAIAPPVDVSYLWVSLAAGQTWRFDPPAEHNVAWAFSETGSLQVCGVSLERELAVFDEGSGSLEFRAEGGPCCFLFGSAKKHNHSLQLGNYSVHTTPEALRLGEERIRALGQDLRAQGLLNQ